MTGRLVTGDEGQDSQWWALLRPAIGRNRCPIGAYLSGASANSDWRSIGATKLHADWWINLHADWSKWGAVCELSRCAVWLG